jgi:hypothetical protein
MIAKEDVTDENAKFYIRQLEAELEKVKKEKEFLFSALRGHFRNAFLDQHKKGMLPFSQVELLEEQEMRRITSDLINIHIAART